jgi:hypothetical protein
MRLTLRPGATGHRKAVRQVPDLRQYAGIADSYLAPGGWSVEVVRLSGTPDHHDGEWIRIRQYGAYVKSSGIALDERDPHVAAGVLPYRT